MLYEINDHVIYEMLCAIWCRLYNLKNVKKAHGGVLLTKVAV